MKKKIIEEFKERFKLSDQQWQSFLNEYSENELTVKELADKYKVSYNPLRYLFYSLNFVNNSKANRIESVMNLQKELSKEDGQEYNLVEELEKELDVVLKKNKALTKSLILTRDENNNLRKMGRKEARKENLMENLMEDIEQGLHSVKLPELPFMLVDRSILNKQEVQPFAFLSDLHYNEIVEGKYIEDYNEFNNQICLEGIDKVLTKVQKYGGSTLRIYLGGDLLSGLIHRLDLKGQSPVTSSVIELAYFLADRINKLAKQYKNIKILMVNGNHSRISEKPKLDLKAFDFEHLMFELMKAQIKEDNVELHYSISTYLIDNIGTEDKPKYVGLVHGDNKSFNPTAEATVLKQFGIFDELFGVRVHSLMLGHTHKPIFTPSPRGGSIIINGCMSGSNEFGFNANFLPLQPYQWVGTWNKEGYAEDIECVRIR